PSHRRVSSPTPTRGPGWIRSHRSGATAIGARSSRGGKRILARSPARLRWVTPQSHRARRRCPARIAACRRCAGLSRCAACRTMSLPMSDSRTTSDDDARAAALDVSRSFIVEAPAGSGKTELLLQRFLALLARVERPEAIIGMTFTRKAAGEIRDRILVALRGAEDESPAEPHLALTWRLARAALQHDAALGWNLIAHPARLQVHTIDALCLALARQAPLTVKLGAMPRHAAATLARGGREHRLAAFLDDDTLPPASADGLPRWQAIADWLLTKKGVLRVQVNKNQGFFADDEIGSAGRETRKQAME